MDRQTPSTGRDREGGRERGRGEWGERERDLCMLHIKIIIRNEFLGYGGVAQLIESLPICVKPWIQFPALHNLCLVAL